jgi:hypothetical protein
MNPYNLVPSVLMEYIRDMSCDTPRKNYDKIIKQLKREFCHPICGDSCNYIVEFKDGSFLRRPVLINQVYIKCIKCQFWVSRLDHEVCHDCAKQYDNPMEFSYHHSKCKV